MPQRCRSGLRQLRQQELESSPPPFGFSGSKNEPVHIAPTGLRPPAPGAKGIQPPSTACPEGPQSGPVPLHACLTPAACAAAARPANSSWTRIHKTG
eukprot:scaffold1340_cov109-Isochrysis_galbana.AAC.1